MNGDTTIKSHGGLLQEGENEIEAARTAALKSYDQYFQDPTDANRDAMYAAYEYLGRVKYAYVEARKLLLQRVSEQQEKPA